MADTFYRGKITRVTTTGVYVEVPRLGVGVEYGPCEVLSPAVAVASVDGLPYTQPDSDVGGDESSHAWRTHNHQIGGYDPATQNTTLAGHQHAIHGGVPGMKVGQRVLLTTVGGVQGDLVVLGTLA